MKRSDVTKEMVETAIRTYFRLAYGSEPRKSHTTDVGDPFHLFVDETRSTGDESEPLERHTLRLGNRNYPFMKLVLQEHVVPGEFYFSVDAHDEIEIRPDFPDYEAWMKVKRFNRDLKGEILAAFDEAGLPTRASLGSTVLEPAPRRRGAPLILVVDDEEREARTLEQVLRREGYDVALAFDGREALERLAVLRPSLIVLDYEMPELDGMQVIRALREDVQTRSLPILLTTASQVLQRERAEADGFLPKPFASSDLLKHVERLLGR